MWKKIWNWILNLFGKGEDEVSSNDIDLSKAIWHGVNGAGAKVSETMSSINYIDDKIHYVISPGTADWRPINAQEKDCNQYGCYFVHRNGQYMGGKFEWSTYSRKFRTDHNIRSGKAGGIKPFKGETVWICFTDLNGKNRTNALHITWK